MLEMFLLHVVGINRDAPDSFTAYCDQKSGNDERDRCYMRRQWSSSQLHEATALAAVVLSRMCCCRSQPHYIQYCSAK